MSEWWTYRPSDFLMFSGRTWERVVQGWNESLWPAQVLLLVLAIGLVAAAARDGRRHARWILAVLAAGWAFVGWAFHAQRFAEVNTAAGWLAVAFGLQAVALGFAAAASPAALPAAGGRGSGLALAAVAAGGYPLATVFLRGSGSQAEVALAFPDPTALLTVGLLLALPLRARAALLAIPLLAVLVGAVTAWLLWAG